MGDDRERGPGKDDLDALRAALGGRVRTLRSERGWTQEELADQCGLDARHVQKIEHGSHSATLKTLLHLARGFGVTVADLFAGVG